MVTRWVAYTTKEQKKYYWTKSGISSDISEARFYKSYETCRKFAPSTFSILEVVINESSNNTSFDLRADNYFSGHRRGSESTSDNTDDQPAYPN